MNGFIGITNLLSDLKGITRLQWLLRYDCKRGTGLRSVHGDSGEELNRS